MDRIDFLRHEIPPVGSLLYVFFTETADLVPLYLDKNKTQSITQPIVINNDNVHFYADNTRVDMKIVHSTYPSGFILIEDQILFDPDEYVSGGSYLTYTYNVMVDGITDTPKPPNMVSGSERVYLNGVHLREGSDNDYFINNSTIDFLNGWRLYINDVVEMEYYVI